MGSRSALRLGDARLGWCGAVSPSAAAVRGPDAGLARRLPPSSLPLCSTGGHSGRPSCPVTSLLALQVFPVSPSSLFGCPSQAAGDAGPADEGRQPPGPLGSQKRVEPSASTSAPTSPEAQGRWGELSLPMEPFFCPKDASAHPTIKGIAHRGNNKFRSLNRVC